MATLSDAERADVQALLVKAEASYRALMGEAEVTSLSHGNGAGTRSMGFRPVDQAGLRADIARYRKLLGLSDSYLFDAPALHAPLISAAHT